MAEVKRKIQYSIRLLHKAYPTDTIMAINICTVEDYERAEKIREQMQDQVGVGSDTKKLVLIDPVYRTAITVEYDNPKHRYCGIIIVPVADYSGVFTDDMTKYFAKKLAEAQA